MAKKTTTKSKPEIIAKPAAKSAAKPKAAVPPPPKAVMAPALVPDEPKPKAAVKAKRAVKQSAPKPPAYTQDDVALRAYFISEKRRTEGLPGDEHQDWIEAERQIAAESAGKKKTAKKA